VTSEPRFACDLIVFDLDGTLVDSLADITRSVNVALGEVGLPPKTSRQIVDMIGNGTRALVERAVDGHRDRFETAFAAFTKDYGAHLLDQTRFYPGAVELLRCLRPKKLAVMSNKRQRFCDAILRGLGADGYFQVIQGGDTARAKKPDPAPLLHICLLLAVEPARAAMVGDSPVDVAAGKAAGMFTVGITGGFTPAGIMAKSGADLLVPDLASLNPAVFGTSLS
jgi:phosphoglycolate phosphatase